MLRQALQRILKSLAVAALRRHKPQVIAVTGTVGKTSAKEAIALVLSKKFSVRKSEKNYNTEIGVPLAILGIESGGSSVFGWMKALFGAFKTAYVSKTYPEVLVLEFGVDKPGDMKYLTNFVKLDYAFVTALGDIPVHVEAFPNREALWEEKMVIAKGLKPDGVLFYNADDAELLRLASAKSAHAISYGSLPEARMRLGNIQKLPTDHAHPFGLSCTIFEGGEALELTLPLLLAAHQLSAVCAAVCAGIAFEIPKNDISKVLSSYEPPPGRMRLIHGVKKTLVIDDTYNASPASSIAALETLKGFSGHRRIAVLGDMLELGTYSDEAHRQIGRLVAGSADVFFAVGGRMALVAEAAKSAGAKDVRTFALSPEAGKPLELELKPGDIVLVKGSQSMRMEKIVEEVMAEPDRAGELLVRQETYWKEKEIKPV